MAVDKSLRFIPEVQGLRTLALLLVVTFHIWFGRVSGGVDVFLLVSAFLLTRSLTVRAEEGTPDRPLTTILRRFARLLPVAAAVIVLTVLASWLLMPRHTWSGTHWDALASLFYVENWRLIALQVDYYAGSHAATSLFQHFWSLSVQGQIFILWPLLHVLGGWFARRTGRPVRRVLLWLFGAVFAASFGCSVWLTAVDQQVAYFDTFARTWEFAAGSLLALVLPWLRLGERARALAGWLGVLLLVSCGLLLPVDSTFPGFAALWPVTAALLVIVAAGAPTRFGADRLLTRRWFGGIGGYTYALYLVHWPVMLLYRQVTGQDAPGLGLGLVDGLVIMLLSAAISVALVHLVERPAAAWLRTQTAVSAPHSHIPKRAPAVLIAACLLFGTVLTGGGELARNAASKAEAAQAQVALGGETVAPEPTPTEEDRSPGWDPVLLELGAEAPDLPAIADPLPGAGSIEYQWVGEGSDCTEHITPPGTDGICWETEPDPSVPTVLFVGNSHTQQFAELGYAAAEVAGYPNVRIQAGPGCAFRAGDDELDDACGKTWRAALEYVTAEYPEVVVLLGTMSQFGAEDEPMTGVPAWVEKISAASPETEVVVLRDSPRFAVAPYECALANGWDAAECQHPAPPSVDAAFIAEVETAGATWVDLNPQICPDDLCRPQVGQVVVWFDDNHLSAAFVHTLAQHFADAVAESVPAWPAEIYLRP
ncbi:acyltransferase family protein [Gulosibacter chungangensis]|uniref:acyltransferase family protein n=1 Tax=Gulosibacter chungangensis TaxID=979746 RepID=UPI0017882A3D|nr:acyltransferase family protein [Gulosibacter chungangensis]